MNSDSNVQSSDSNEMLCAIWFHLHNLKNVKNTHGGVLAKVQALVTLLHECFSCFLNCTYGTESHKISQIVSRHVLMGLEIALKDYLSNIIFHIFAQASA